jgi:hypothetical protein
MPSILETPETVAIDSEISWQTLEQEGGVHPALEVGLLPKQSLLTTLLQKLHLSSAPEPHSHYSHGTEGGAIDMLARDYPHIFTRLLCG